MTEQKMVFTEKIDEMIKEIDGWIKIANREFEVSGRSEFYNKTMVIICKMIEILEIATEELWVFDESGVHKFSTQAYKEKL